MGDDLFNIANFILCIFGVLIAHLSVNVLNDYFDVKDGTDEENSEYFQQVSGGSRAIELGLITLEGTKKLGTILTLVALIISLQSNSDALKVAAVSVEKNGLPVPAAKITILFLSKCLIALLLIYGSAICDIVIAD